MEEGQLTASKPIPKFTSFRSQPPVTNQSRRCEAKDNADERSLETLRISRKHKSNYRGEVVYHEYRKHIPGSSRGSSSKKQEGLTKGRHTQKQDIVDTWDDSLKTFVVDKLGDPANLTYGKLHRYQIPSYRRSGYGSVIGILSRFKIQRDKSSDNDLVISGDTLKQSTRGDKNILEKVVHDPSGEVSIRRELLASQSENPNADYVPFSPSRPKKRKLGDWRADYDSQSSTSTDESSVNYRSVEGKAKPTGDPEDLDLQYVAKASIPGELTPSMIDSEETTQQAVAALSQKLDTEPANGQLWIDLINHQGGYSSAEHRSKTTKAESLSTAEIKLSIYDKALSKVTDWHFRELLIFGMLEEGFKVWDTSKLASKWRKILRTHPGYVRLWVKYLDFQQTTFSKFRHEKFVEVCRECLQVVKEAKSQKDNSATSEARYYEIQAYLLIRLTSSMKESGYSENAIAIWQSVLEFNMFRPRRYRRNCTTSERSSNADIMKSFEDFWESEVPRIGEENSRGWEHFDTNEGSPPTPKKDPDTTFLNSMRTIRLWDEMERSQALQAREPARTIDDVEANDPYRVVMFSDVQPFLIDFSSDSHNILICAFLAFCHLPSPSTLTNSPRVWWRDAFIRNEVLQSLEGHLPNWNIVESTQVVANLADSTDTSSTDPTVSKKRTALEFPISSILASTDSEFTKSWFSCFTAWKSECSDNAGSVDMSCVCQILRTLVDVPGIGDDLAEYLIAFELHSTPAFARKRAKTLLKERPSSLRLYNAYAILECRLGKVSVAYSIFATAINMSRTLDANSQRDVILLWKTWVWEVLIHESPSQAFQLLLTFPDQEIHPTLGHVSRADDKRSDRMAVLRTQRALSDGRDSMISLGSYYHASMYIECLVLLEYLDHELSLESALSSFNCNMALIVPRLPSTSSLQESIHQSRTILLDYHLNHIRSCKPALIRSALSESIRLFPHNTMFLSLYSWNESQFRIDDRVRSIVHDIIQSDTSSEMHESTENIIPHFFAVYTELHRGLTLGSNTHSIRATFERAVESPTGKQSAALWKLFFLFEYSRHEEKQKRARDVFYRAIMACPWAKELYMLAFRYLEGILRLEELRGVYEAMLEKGLRVHVSLNDDMWEKLDASKGGRVA